MISHVVDVVEGGLELKEGEMCDALQNFVQRHESREYRFSLGIYRKSIGTT